LVGQHRSVPDLMKAVADIGPVEVVAKQAHEGASCLAGAGVYSTPVHPVTVVDTVGAGDAFVAGYLSQRLAGRTPQKSLLRGAICGALACTEAGDWEGAPQLEDVIALEKGVLV
jgi:2-dehydro-3-deoxygluconokinase